MSLNNKAVDVAIICNEKKEVDLDALNLLASNGVSLLCQCSYKNQNKHHHFIYNTHDMMSLATLQAGLSFENIIDLLSDSLDMLDKLDENNLILDNVKNAKEYIFKSDEGHCFIYIPLVHKKHLTVRDYFLKLLAVVSHKDIRLTTLIKELKKQKQDDKAKECLKTFVNSYKTEDVYYDANQMPSEDGATTLLDAPDNSFNAAEVIDTPSDEGETTVLSQAQYTEESEETTVLSQEHHSGDDETTVLSQDMYEYPGLANNMHTTAKLIHHESSEYETTVLSSETLPHSKHSYKDIHSDHTLSLIKCLTGEKVMVDITPFAIGKDAANMDLVLINETVSRNHASIVFENGKYFIIDNNSTNGTTIEGVIVQPGEKAEIGDGCIISIGNETFQSQIEFTH